MSERLYAAIARPNRGVNPLPHQYASKPAGMRMTELLSKTKIFAALAA